MYRNGVRRRSDIPLPCRPYSIGDRSPSTACAFVLHCQWYGIANWLASRRSVFNLQKHSSDNHLHEFVNQRLVHVVIGDPILYFLFLVAASVICWLYSLINGHQLINWIFLCFLDYQSLWGGVQKISMIVLSSLHSYEISFALDSLQQILSWKEMFFF